MKTGLLNSCLAFMALISTSTFAERGASRDAVDPFGWVYGGAVNVSEQLYKGFETRSMLIPFVGYRGERLQVFGPFVTYDLTSSEGWSLNARLSPRFGSFDEQDSPTFAGMAPRKTSLDVGLGLRYEWQDLRLSLSAVGDVLGHSKGSESTLSASKVFRYGPFFFEPSVSLSLQDQSLVDYYYGVRSSEATSQRVAYRADAALNKAIGFSFMTPVLFNGLTRLSLTYNQYDDAIVDSPLVSGNSGISSMLIFSRMF